MREKERNGKMRKRRGWKLRKRREERKGQTWTGKERREKESD